MHQAENDECVKAIAPKKMAEIKPEKPKEPVKEARAYSAVPIPDDK